VFVQSLDETTPRYGMLETIREFALEQPNSSGTWRPQPNPGSVCSG
jgi:hypothetical protein